jgi:transposase
LAATVARLAWWPAPVEPRIVEKSLVSDRIVIDTLIRKYSDHLPLYRQSAMLERDAGVEISRSTTDGWVMRVGELLLPMVAAIKRELLAGTYCRPMKRRSRYNCILAKEPTIRPISGSTDGRKLARFLIFAWAGGGKVQRCFLAATKGFCRPTATPVRDRVGGPQMTHAACGRMRDENFIKPPNSIPPMWWLPASWS